MTTCIRMLHNKVWPMFVLAACLAGACGGGGGAGQFDNAKAGKAIMDSIRADQVSFLRASGKALECTEREGSASPQQYKAFCNGTKERQAGFTKLEEKGLLKVYSDQASGCFYMAFSEKAEPYIKKQAKGVVVFLATVEKIDVIDLGSGKQQRTVKYKAHYAPTPFGEVLLGPTIPAEEREAGFTLSFDEGWRIN